MLRSPARQVALAALRRWRTSSEFADRIIQRLLSSRALPAPERAFAQELFYGVLRNLSLIDFYIGRLRRGPLDPLGRDLIRLGLFQLFQLHTASHAAVFETVQLAPAGKRGLVNGILRNAIRNRDSLLAEAESQPLHVRESHPEWLVSRWRSRFGKASTVALCRWNNQPAPVYARINRFRVQQEDFLLRHPETHSIPAQELFVRCDELPHAALDRGECYIQDPSTALAVDLLDPHPGETILDACAAPGGKTFQIADKTAHEVDLVVCDRDNARLDRVKENIRRLDLGQIRVIQHDWLHDPSFGPFETERFDKILVDAPCTNTGVMRRRMDVRWRLTPADFDLIADQQFRIVAAVLPLLRSDGVLVYSTCSIEPEENEEVVARLQREFPGLRLDQTQTSLPFQDGFDGVFAARMVLKA